MKHTTGSVLSLFFVLVLTAMSFPLNVEAAGRARTNSQQARQLFNEVYKKVFGPDGCSLSYAINIIGIYKTAGNIAMHGKKFHYTESRYHSWCDGHTLYRADTKKNVVDIFDPNKVNKDNMLSRYTYDINKFIYSWERTKEGIVLNIDAPNGSSGSIKHAKAIIDPTTHNPIAIKIKVAFFWTTVKLSRFRSGGINDNIFIFPKARFKSYKFVDKRNE